MPVEITQLPPQNAVPPDPLIGTEVKETYRIVRKIGSGGMGTIYEAAHVHLPKRFALKVMLPEVAADQVSFERFRREAVTTSSLGNPYIAEVIDFNLLPDGSPYMVMEYLEGEDLGARLAKRNWLAPEQVSSLIANVASALSSAHAKAILHRDIKPPNIFLARRPDGSEVVKLLDFGAAKSKRANDLTAKGQVVGTPWYMSPEQARGHELDARSDEFSLAVVAFEALCGRLPFDDEDPVKVLFRIVDDPPVPLRTYNPRLPAEVGLVIEKALSKEPDDRYATVAEFASHLTSALGTVADSYSAEMAKPFPATPRASPAVATITLPVHDSSAPATDPAGEAVVSQESSPSKAALTAGGLAAVVVLAVGGFLIWGPKATSPSPVALSAPPAPMIAAPQPPPPKAKPVAPPPQMAEPAPAPAAAALAPAPTPNAPTLGMRAPASKPPAPAHSVPTAPTPHAVVVTPPPVVTAPPVNPPTPVADAAPKSGYLTLDTTPWTQVFEGSKFLGDTPLARLALPAGTHQLRLANPDQNVKQTVEVVIKPDQTTVTKLEF